MKYLKKVLLLIFFTITIFPLFSQSSIPLVPSEMVIVGFDKSINSADDNLIVTINTSSITENTNWLITNAVYNGDGTNDIWNTENSDFISFDITYKGSERIPKNSYISYRTNSLTISDPLTIFINGLNKTVLFSIHKKASPLKSDNTIITNSAFYLKQGLYYNELNHSKFLGTVIDGLFFGSNLKIPVDIGFFKSGSELDPGAGSGDFDDQLCDCEELEETQNLNKWTINNGPNGKGGEDIDDTGNDEGETNCPCEGELIIEESNCKIYVNTQASTLHCDNFEFYEWVITYLDGTIEIVNGGTFNYLDDIQFDFFFVAQFQLIVNCSDCSIESNVIFTDCGNAYCPPKATQEIGQCNLTVFVTECPFDYEIEWYKSGSPSEYLPEFDGEDMLSVESNGCYFYILSCGTCEDIVSDLFCFDDCEIDCGLVYPGVSATTNSIIVYDFCYPIPDAFCTVELTDLDINGHSVLNDTPFSFPYCFKENPNCNDGLPSECHPGSSSWSILVDHINTWLSNNGFAGTASWSNDPSHPCHGESNFPVYLLIEGTDASFGSSQFILNGNVVDIVNPDSYNVQTIDISVTYTISNLCEGGTIEWSNGDTNTLSSTYPYGSAFSVTVTCPNGCIYVLDDVDCSNTGCQIAVIPWDTGGANWQIMDEKGIEYPFLDTSMMTGCVYPNEFDEIIEDEIFNVIEGITNCDISNLEICVVQSGSWCHIIINNAPVNFLDISHENGSFDFNSSPEPCSCEPLYPLQHETIILHDLESGINPQVDVETNELLNVDHIRVFPNPSSDKFNITFDNPEDEIVVLDLFDVSGKLVKHKPSNIEKMNGYHVLDCSSFEAGMYMLQVSTVTRNFPLQKLVIIK